MYIYDYGQGEQKNRQLDEKLPIVFKGVNDFSPTKYNEQMERQRAEEQRQKQLESEQCFGCMVAFMQTEYCSV